MAQSWFAWTVNIGLLPNLSESFILVAIAVLGLVLYHLKSHDWYLDRIHAKVLEEKEKTQPKKEAGQPNISTHSLTPEEFAKVQSDLGEVPTPIINEKPDPIPHPNSDLLYTPDPALEVESLSKWKRLKNKTKDKLHMKGSKTPPLLSPRTNRYQATELAIQDVHEGWTGGPLTPPPTTPGGTHLHKSTTLKKVMRVTGRSSAAAAATVLAVPASLTGALIGGVRGAPRGPTALLSGTVVGAAAGGASVFKSFKLIGKEKKDKSPRVSRSSMELS